MAVSSTTGGLRTGVCLSTDRPQNPYNGQVVYETDTNRTLVWDNSAWVVVADPALVSFSGTGATVTADAMTVAGENVTPYTGRRNLLYNGAMQVAQRGTSNASANSLNYYTADRWQTAISNVGGWTQSVENDAPTGSGFRKSLKMLCTSSFTPSASDYLFLRQKLEGQDLQHIKKGTSSAEQLTVSFWVKSNVTGTYVLALIDEDNSRHASKSYTVSASGTWEKKTITFPADTAGVLDNDNGHSFNVDFWIGAGTVFTSGTLATSWESLVSANRAVGQTNLAAATNNYWQITGVQLEVGNKATPFEHRSYGEELALCQRYYEKSYDMGKNPSPTNDPNGSINVWPHTTTAYGIHIYAPFSVRKRTTPTVTMYDTATGTAGYFMETGFGLRSGQVIFIGETGFTLRNSVVLAGTGYINAHFIASAEL